LAAPSHCKSPVFFLDGGGTAPTMLPSAEIIARATRQNFCCADLLAALLLLAAAGAIVARHPPVPDFGRMT